VTTATAALLAISPLQAGEHAITAQEVEAYFQEAQEEATELVRGDELQRIVEWVDEHFADGAVLQANMNIIHGEDRKGFLSMTLDKDDLTSIGGAFAGRFGQMSFKDFSLEVEVFNVIPHGPDAATVTTRWTERVTLALPPAGARPRPRRARRETPLSRPRSPAAASAALHPATPAAADHRRHPRLAVQYEQRYLFPWPILSGDLEHHRGYAASALIHQIRA
jgi:hypothetical protein